MNEINTAIALQRERREGILGSIETMTKVYEAMKTEPGAEAPSGAPDMAAAAKALPKK